jgi:hypothetical protein
VGYHLYNSLGTLVFVSADYHDSEWRDTLKNKAIYKSVCRIPGSFLNEGSYTLNVAISLDATPTTEVFAEHVVSFEVQDIGDSKVRGKYIGRWGTVGALRPLLDWKTTELEKINGPDSQ